jgi:hypothetical protein
MNFSGQKAVAINATKMVNIFMVSPNWTWTDILEGQDNKPRLHHGRVLLDKRE